MRKHKKECYNDPWERDFYGTGSTRPPKSYGGILAVLLVAVILLGGVCSALGIINLQLLRQLAAMEEKPDSVTLFADPTAVPESLGANLADAQPEQHFPALGFWGQTVSDFDRRFYQMPRGVLVTKVAEGLEAQQAGLRAGDVIVVLGDCSVSDRETLLAALEHCEAGETVKVDFYRQCTGQQMSITVTLSEE